MLKASACISFRRGKKLKAGIKARFLLSHLLLLQVQFRSCLGGFGDKRRDGPEFAIQFPFEGALFRRGQVVKNG